MSRDDALLRVDFRNSGEERQLALSELVSALSGFLDHFGVKPFVDHAFNGDNTSFVFFSLRTEYIT